MKNIKKIAYEKFKLVWLMEHGYSLIDLMKALDTYQNENDMYFIDLDEVFNEWEQNSGFGSEIWPCFEEFVESEYKMEGLMKDILSKDEFSIYEVEIRCEEVLFDEDAKHVYEIAFPISNAICPRYRVYADELQAALDLLMDHFVETEQTNMYYTENPFEEEDPCCFGNNGYYFGCLEIIAKEVV